MSAAISQIGLPLAAILHVPMPYDTETNEILLWLNIDSLEKMQSVLAVHKSKIDFYLQKQSVPASKLSLG